MINNADEIDFNELVNTAFEAGLGYSLLALIDVANKLEHNDAFYKVLSRQYPPNIEGNVIQDNIYPVHKFRQLIKRSFLERSGGMLVLLSLLMISIRCTVIITCCLCMVKGQGNIFIEKNPK